MIFEEVEDCESDKGCKDSESKHLGPKFAAATKLAVLFGQAFVDQMFEADVVHSLDCLNCELSSSASLLNFLSLLDVVGVNVVSEDLIERFVDLLGVEAVFWDDEVDFGIHCKCISPVKKHHCNFSIDHLDSVWNLV